MPKMVLWPDIPLELKTLNLVCIHNLTLGVTWAGSHLARMVFSKNRFSKNWIQGSKNWYNGILCAAREFT